MYSIVIDKKGESKLVGKASCKDELEPLLNDLEIKILVRADVWRDIDHVFKVIGKEQKKDSYIMNYKSININVISNGYEITTIVFYL